MNGNDVIVSLDIGTSQVRVIIGEWTGQTLNIVGVGTAPSRGVHKGKIVNIDQTVEAIRSAVNHAEQMVGITIEHVYCGISDATMQLQSNRGIVAVSREDREIGTEDVERAIQAARVISLPPERDIIGIVPKQFIVDGLDGIHDPRGMIGVRLEVEATVITGSKTTIHNLMRSVEKAELKIAKLIHTPLAAGQLALLKDEQNLGVVLVDIGAGATTISLFEQGELIATSTLEMGGDFITKDISIGFKTPEEYAEKIKLKFGCAIESEGSEEVTFSVLRIGSNVEKTFTQANLASVMEPRLIEMLEYIENEVQRMHPHDFAVGYVLTGGVAATSGIQQLAQEIWNKPVRIAVPEYIGVREPSYTTGVGLIAYASKQGHEMGNGSSKAKGRKHTNHRRKTWERVKTWMNEFI